MINFIFIKFSIGQKWRLLVLDACYESDHLGTGQLGPVEPFMTDSVLKDLNECLEDNGSGI